MRLLDSLLRNYRNSRDLLTLKTSSLLDEQWYFRFYPDVAQSGFSAASHYMLHGAREKRDPSRAFSTQAYLERYSDVERSGMNPLLHYIRHGLAEGRAATRSTARRSLVDPESDRLDNLSDAASDPKTVAQSAKSISEFRAQLPSAADHDGIGRVPKIFHFVYGFKDSGDLPYYGYMAIRSALHFNPGWAVFLYAMHEPAGDNWNRIKKNVTLIKVSNFEYFGNARLHHYAHKADIIRLIALNQVGGVYLDLDTITKRSYEDLRKAEFCMAVQSAGNDSSSGLCNAVMIGQPGARFSTEWITHYDYFRSRGRDDLWDYHSVKLPVILMSKAPEWITVLDYRAFFYPLWHTVEKMLFTDGGRQFMDAFDQTYCFHLWNGQSGLTLNSLNENFVRNSRSIYAEIARQVEGF